MVGRRALAGLFGGAVLALPGIACAQRLGPPPPLRLEPPPGRPPGRNLVWEPGHWERGRRDYVWVRGRWVRARRGAWEHGRWDDRRGGPAWVPGGWR